MAKQYTSADIDAYLNGQMEEVARNQFEAALAEDVQLAEEVDTFRAEQAVFQLLEKDTLLDQLQNWDKEEEQQAATKPFKWILLAIALMLLIALAFYLYPWSVPSPPPPSEETEIPLEKEQDQEETPLQETPPTIPPTQPPPPSPPIAALNYQDLADRYYRQAPFADQLRTKESGIKTDSSDYQKAQQRYLDNNFTAAMEILNAPDSTQLKKYLYLRAHTHYQLKDYRAAQLDFATFREFRISDRKKDAIWGEVLSLLQLMPDSRSELYATLEEITTQGASSYYDEATDLLTVLQNNE